MQAIYIKVIRIKSLVESTWKLFVYGRVLVSTLNIKPQNFTLSTVPFHFIDLAPLAMKSGRQAISGL